MANYEVYYNFTIIDANGHTANIRVPGGTTADTATLANLAGSSGVAGFLTALGAPGTVTNGKVISASIGVLYEKAGPSGAVDAEFSGVEDGARLTFLNSLGGRGAITIPAPVPAVFGAAPMENVVDPAGPISALITWFEAHGEEGSTFLNVYNGGRKVAHHARKRSQFRVP